MEIAGHFEISADQRDTLLEIYSWVAERTGFFVDHALCRRGTSPSGDLPLVGVIMGSQVRTFSSIEQWLRAKLRPWE
jgi:hypothetical protein